MKIHNVYYHPIKDELKIIKEGNSYFAFIFTILWAAYNKIWHILVLAVGFALLGHFLEVQNIMSQQQTHVIGTLLRSICFVFSEELVAQNIESQGFVLQEIVLANSPIEAELKYHQLRNNSNV